MKKMSKKNNKYYSYIRQKIIDAVFVKQKIYKYKNLLQNIIKCSSLITKALRKNKTVFFAGNGGSAADAQHLAAEFVSRFEFDRKGLSAYSLTTDTSVLTAIGNDYGFKNVFARQLNAHAKKGDILIAISTSGKSENILNALLTAKEKKVVSIFLCSENLYQEDKSDYTLKVPSRNTARIQECHIFIGHLICGLVEEMYFNDAESTPQN